MRGRGNSYPPHGRHINDAFPGLWPLRFRRSQLKLRRQQFWCCQLFFNCPFYGGQAPPPAYPASTPPSKPVRPHILLPKKPKGFSGKGFAVCCLYHLCAMAHRLCAGSLRDIFVHAHTAAENDCCFRVCGRELCEAVCTAAIFCPAESYFHLHAGFSGTQGEHKIIVRRDPAASPAPDTPHPWYPR